jgi:hypothetical protein
MKYNPSKEAESGGKAPEGEYDFTVRDAIEKRFNSGKDGAALTLVADVAPGRSVKTFANVFYNDKAQWKLKAFMDAVGADFYRPPEDIAQLIGLRGRAKFKHNEKGYLEADEFLPRPAGAPPVTLAPPPAKASYDDVGPKSWDDQPPPHGDDDVPF